MNRKTLTIAIPTYNRPEPLAATLRQLSLQDGIGDCEVIVSDNASATDLEAFIRDRMPDLPPNFRFQRNAANVGVTGNILRCVEAAGSEWVWILADDDDLSDGAVRKLLSVCDAGEGLDFVMFSQAECQKGGVRVGSSEELLKEIDFWARMGFLPISIYRTSRIREILNVGSTYAYTLFPHVSMLFYGLETNGWKGALDSFIPVRAAHRGEDFWPLMLAINGYITAELVDSPKVARAILRLASKWCLGPVGLTHEFLKMRSSGKGGLSRLSYDHKMFLIRQVSFRHRITACFCQLASYLPASLVLGAISLGRRVIGKGHDNRPGGQDLYGRI